ncbi:MAG: L7Ae/L30e/S12e/Gadd45 family ribosomal protein [Cellulosilyticaceae bacterium]
MNNQRIYQLIGLCQKGRMLVSGEFAVKQAVLDKQVHLVIVAEDASNNTTKLFTDKCAYRSIECVKWSTKVELGRILGRDARAVIGIIDQKLAEKINDMIKSDG